MPIVHIQEKNMKEKQKNLVKKTSPILHIKEKKNDKKCQIKFGKEKNGKIQIVIKQSDRRRNYTKEKRKKLQKE
jgi:hypothetical protein